MKISDIVIGEVYAVDFSGAHGHQHVLDHTLPEEDDEDELRVFGFSRRRLRWDELVRAAYDYGRYLETDQLPDWPGSWPRAGFPYHRFACGTVLTKAKPYGKTRLGVRVRVPFFDWWPVQRWCWSQPRGSFEDPPEEVLAEVRMMPYHATFMINARQLAMPWGELPAWRLPHEIEWHQRIVRWKANHPDKDDEQCDR